jgi:hypothetical protein
MIEKEFIDMAGSRAGLRTPLRTHFHSFEDRESFMRSTITSLRAMASLLGALGLTTLAQAQPFGELMSPPSAPANVVPATGATLEGRTGGATLLSAVSWGQFFPTGPGPFLNPAATHFLVCLDAYTGATAPPCTIATADFTETIASPSALLFRNGNQFTLIVLRTIANAELNAPFRVTVVACSALMNQSCRATGSDIYFSARNIVAAGAGDSGPLTTVNNWAIDARATNPGTTAVPQFDGRIEMFEALGFGNPGRDCRRDVDAADVRMDATLFAIDEFGTMTPLPSLNRPGGSYIGPRIAGIVRMGSFSASGNFTTLNPSLLAGQAAIRGVGSVNFAIPSAGLQRTFVALSRFDTGLAIREYIETDNASAKCMKR